MPPRPKRRKRGVLVQQDGEDRFGHHIADGLVRQGAEVALLESRRALPPGGILILGLGYAGEKAGDREGIRVE